MLLKDKSTSRETYIKRHPITLAQMQKDPLFIEDGFWHHNITLRGDLYRIFIIKDSEGLYTLGITGSRLSSRSAMEHGYSLPSVIDRLNVLLIEIERHDISVLGLGEGMHVLA